MPHPVGGAMGVTLSHCREKGDSLCSPILRSGTCAVIT